MAKKSAQDTDGDTGHVQDVKHRGFYLLPNLITTAALCAGFYAIVAGMHGRFTAAAVAIFVASILDGLDGRVARITGTSSEFGTEYDSFSDMLSFGLAPALVIFSWSLHHLNKLGWLVAFLYVVATALRLARFNTVNTDDKRYFHGLASPCAAGAIAGFIWIGSSYGLVANDFKWIALALTICVSILMVSNIRYRSFKDIERDKVPFVALFMVVLLFIMVVLEPPIVLFGMAMVYALSGPVLTLVRWLRKPKNS